MDGFSVFVALTKLFVRLQDSGGALVTCGLELVGKVAVWRDELPLAIYNSNILRIAFKPHKVSGSFYMNYFFNSDLGVSQLRLMAKGTTSVAAIYYKDLASIRIPLPPLPEQNAITTFLDAETAKLDALVAEAEGVIALLQERRSALISAAVTGGIDVRKTYYDKNSGNLT